MASSAVDERAATNQAVSQEVISAVANVTGSDPTSLEPLYQVIDPDALDTLLESNGPSHNRSPVRISFNYCGCEVEIDKTGEVHVSQTEQDTGK